MSSRRYRDEATASQYGCGCFFLLLLFVVVWSGLSVLLMLVWNGVFVQLFPGLPVISFVQAFVVIVVGGTVFKAVFK